MFGRHVRLAKQYDKRSVRMALAHFAELRGRVAVARTNSAHVFARHAVEPTDSIGVVACRSEQLKQRFPGVAPIMVDPQPLAQFLLANFATPPGIENRL